ncbi:MAG: ATP-binding protein [Candidatus Brockarchaeota archaeon]|nr:ATP-binding protein [Candidatus Brockarchaeota archaeon]
MADDNNRMFDPVYVAVIIILLINVLKNFSSLQFFPSISSPAGGLYIMMLLLPVALLLLYKRPSLVEHLAFRENEDYLIAKTGSSELVVGAVSILPEEGSGRIVEEEDFYLKTKGLFNGILKAGISITFVSHILPSGNSDDVLLAQLLVVSRKIGRGGVDEAVKMLGTDFEKIRSVYNTVFPELKLVRLRGKELIKYLRRILVDDSVTKRVDADSSIKILTPHMPDDELCFLSSSYRPSTDTVETKETIDLGSIVFNGSSIMPLRLEADKFKKHMAVYGSTGSGKTTTVKHVLRKLAGLGYPFMVLDWHNEYRPLAEELNGVVFTLGSFSLDILNPVEASNLSEHVAIVTDIFDQIYGFTPSQSYMFREVLLQTLTEKELGIPASNSLRGLVEALERWSIKSFYENETKFALLRRLKPLVTGQSREIFCNTSRLVKIGDIIDRNVVFELGDIVEVDIRKLVSLFILALLYEFRVKNKSARNHFTVVEEAHNILPYRRRDSPPGIAEKLFLEMRKFNESLILVSQFPSQISPEIVKSTSLKISHRICEGEESRVLTDIMGLSQGDYELLKKQTPGYGFLTAEGFSKPVLFTIGINGRGSPFSQGSSEGSQPSQPCHPYT